MYSNMTCHASSAHVKYISKALSLRNEFLPQYVLSVLSSSSTDTHDGKVMKAVEHVYLPNQDTSLGRYMYSSPTNHPSLPSPPPTVRFLSPLTSTLFSALKNPLSPPSTPWLSAVPGLRVKLTSLCGCVSATVPRLGGWYGLSFVFDAPRGGDPLSSLPSGGGGEGEGAGRASVGCRFLKDDAAMGGDVRRVKDTFEWVERVEAVEGGGAVGAGEEEAPNVEQYRAEPYPRLRCGERGFVGSGR